MQQLTGDADRSRYLATMAKVPLFRYLKPEPLSRLYDLSEVLRYASEERVITEGEMSPYLFAVLDGSVNVSVTDSAGRDVYISVVGAGFAFGEAGIFLSVKRTANITSAEKCTILRIHREKFLRFIKDEPSAGIQLLMVIIYGLLRKLREVNQELAFERKSDIGQDDIDDLVAEFMKG